MTTSPARCASGLTKVPPYPSDEIDFGEAIALVLRLRLWQFGSGMSAQEIITELPKLTRPDLERVDAKLHDLLRCSDGAGTSKPWGDALLELAGTAEGLPPDFAQNHDHYLHGAQRR